MARTTDDQYGTPAHRRQANRGAFQAHPIHAVVVRQWQGTDDGPGGNTVLLTNAPVEQPLRVFDDDADRRLIEHCWTQGSQAAVEPGPSPAATRLSEYTELKWLREGRIKGRKLGKFWRVKAEGLEAFINHPAMLTLVDAPAVSAPPANGTPTPPTPSADTPPGAQGGDGGPTPGDR